MVKEALKQAERAQSSVTEALKQATSDIKGTQDLLVSVSLHWFKSPAICSKTCFVMNNFLLLDGTKTL